MKSISPAGGQNSNPSELTIWRLNILLKGVFRDLKTIEGISLLELDFLLNSATADLNMFPLNPSVSNLAPKDFRIGHTQVSLTISMEGTRAAEKTMINVREGYTKLCNRFKRSHLVHPRSSGKLVRKAVEGDLVFIVKFLKNWKVTGVEGNKLHVMYRDTNGSKHEDWHKKDGLTLIQKGNRLTHGAESYPKGAETIASVRPSKECSAEESSHVDGMVKQNSV